MKYELTLTIKDPKIFTLLEPEIQKFSKKRSSIKFNKNSIQIQAADAVALRATSDSIMQLLKVIEKVS